MGFQECGLLGGVNTGIAAILLALFAIAHTVGFRQADPAWGVDPLLRFMQSRHFQVQGFSRTDWDLFLAAGFSVGILYVFAAVLAWQLGGLTEDALARLRLTAWAFALCFVALTIVSAVYLFTIAIVCSGAIAVCLTAAATLNPGAPPPNER